MPTLRLVAVNSRLSEAKAIADKMTDEERKVFADSLNASLSAAKTAGSPQARLDNVKTAASSKDPKRKQAFTAAINSLRRLGFEIDQIAASGNAADLDEAMKRFKWGMAERIALKSNLLAIGAIS
jgi:hypothetical protein